MDPTPSPSIEPRTRPEAAWAACSGALPPSPVRPRRPPYAPVLALVGAFALGLGARELVPARAHAAADDDPTRADARDLIRAVNEVAREIREAARSCK
jgi:hypothetical protein